LLIGVRYLDASLSAYCLRYRRTKGEEPPPRRYSYRLDAASVAISTGLAIFLAIGLGAERDYVWSVVSGIAAVWLAWFAVVRARQNVIGWSRPRGD